MVGVVRGVPRQEETATAGSGAVSNRSVVVTGRAEAEKDVVACPAMPTRAGDGARDD